MDRSDTFFPCQPVLTVSSLHQAGGMRVNAGSTARFPLTGAPGAARQGHLPRSPENNCMHIPGR